MPCVDRVQQQQAQCPDGTVALLNGTNAVQCYQYLEGGQSNSVCVDGEPGFMLMGEACCLVRAAGWGMQGFVEG